MLQHPQIDPVALQLGPLAIHWYGLTYLLAFGLFLLLANARLRHPPFASVTQPPWTRRDVEDILFLGVLGVVTASAGNIRGATRDDILVNQSRVLTVLGGDIVLWSSEGDIDAGKGKKTAAAVPPPVIKFDPVTGAVTQELQGAATGSGIGALITGNVPAGDVDLIELFDPGEDAVQLRGERLQTVFRGLDAGEVRHPAHGRGVDGHAALHIFELWAKTRTGGISVPAPVSQGF